MSPFAQGVSLCAMLFSYQAHDQYPRQEKEEEGGKEFNRRGPPLKEEGQLLRSHSPVDDCKNNQERNNKHEIIKEKIRNGAGSEGGRIDHEKDSRQVDLTCAGEFQKGDDESGDNSGQEIPPRLTFLPDRFVDPLF